MTAGATIMHNDDLTYGSSGIPFNSARFYLKDWPEAGYFSTDCPNPRGEVVVSDKTKFFGILNIQKLPFLWNCMALGGWSKHYFWLL